MPGFDAIAAVSSALVSLLEGARQDTEHATTRVALFQPSDFAIPPEDTVSLYLFRTAVDGTLQISDAPRLSSADRNQPSLRLDLFYLLTGWAGTAVRQQCLLGWAACSLADAPLLPATLLNQNSATATSFADDIALSICLETLSMEQMASIWDGVNAKQQPSLVLVVRGLRLR